MKLKLVSFLHLGAEPRVLQRFTLLGSWSGRCALCGERGPSKVPVFACSTPDSGMYQAMPCKDAEHLKELLFSIESLAPRISTFSGPPPNLIYRGLWVHFNERFDYPVLIFHDGLSPKTRESIVAKTPGQRIWPGAQSMLQPSLHTRTKLIFRFFSVGNWVPSEAQHALHSNFGAGARAQGTGRASKILRLSGIWVGGQRRRVPSACRC